MGLGAGDVAVLDAPAAGLTPEAEKALAKLRTINRVESGLIRIDPAGERRRIIWERPLEG
ncbi:MAG: hypothetical protein WCK05_13190 [Planctomycetota bacterium]